MLKRMLLCFGLMGFVGNVQAGDTLAAERVLGLAIGGSTIAALSAYGSARLMKAFEGTGFSDRSFVATTGSLAAGYAVWALSTQKLLEHFQVQKNYHTPMQGISFLIGALVVYACNQKN